ncbi:hypothetical protein KC973_02650, partial [Candidatus Saccharibacteria bacterium]|nr:hypothetical protein [Candidatus Saccharibacteria bacterium]
DARAKKYEGRSPLSAETKRLVLEDYLERFGDMVSTIQGHGERADEDNPPFDTVIFIDKSARPLAWMMSELWDEFAEPVKGEDGKRRIPEKPDVKFINVDRLFWRDDPTRAGDLREVTDDDIEQLRAIFQIGDSNVLDGRRILIVDEIQESGDTQRATKALIEAAFPSATVDTFAYMMGALDPDVSEPSYIFHLFPTWYPQKDQVKYQETETGRGVLDPVVDRTARADHPRRGSKFLSTPPSEKGPKKEMEAKKNRLLLRLEDIAQNPELDPSGEQRIKIEQLLRQLASGLVRRDSGAEKLRRDMKRLARDFKAGRLQPSVRSDRDTIAGKPTAQYRADKLKRDTTPVPLWKL